MQEKTRQCGNMLTVYYYTQRGSMSLISNEFMPCGEFFTLYIHPCVNLHYSTAQSSHSLATNLTHLNIESNDICII